MTWNMMTDIQSFIVKPLEKASNVNMTLQHGIQFRQNSVNGQNDRYGQNRILVFHRNFPLHKMFFFVAEKAF